MAIVYFSVEGMIMYLEKSSRKGAEDAEYAEVKERCFMLCPLPSFFACFAPWRLCVRKFEIMFVFFGGGSGAY